MGPVTAIALVAKVIEIAESIIAGAKGAEARLAVVKQIVTENRDPTPAEWAALDASENAAFLAVENA